MSRVIQFIVAFFILAGIEILRVYFIMPFPGSQESQTIDIAYFLHQNINWLRFIGLLMIAYPVIYYFKFGNTRAKILICLCLLIYAGIFYLFNFKFLAEKMFYQPEHKIFASVAENKIPRTALVIGLVQDGQAKAYPIEVIGYHHQVRDTVGKTPVMITYCTVCRTGRVYSPLLDGKEATFRLVGMDHFNAMFEDNTTGSWWRQVSGEAIAGPLRGQRLREIPAQQMSLAAWTQEHPDTQIMQPDDSFKQQYAGLMNYDEGKTKGPLTRADTAAWKEKSWVVGLQVGMQSRAYDWRELVKHRVINDTLAGTPVVVALDRDSTSFHVWKRDTLQFIQAAPETGALLSDTQTGSVWSSAGECLDGPLKGNRLTLLQAYQEFWHSWRTFHSNSTQYKHKTN